MHLTDHLNRHTTVPPSALSSRRSRPNTGLPCAVDTSRVYVSPRIAMHRTAATKPESGGVVRYVCTLRFLSPRWQIKRPRPQLYVLDTD